MSKASRRRKKEAPAPTIPGIPPQADFDEVVGLIAAARARAVRAVNKELIDLYWSIGEYIDRKIAAAGWGKGTVEALAAHIQTCQPGMSGFSARNLWRMRQFVESYRDRPELASAVRELSWTHNLLIMSRCQRDEEREFYLRVCLREKWSKRELERQLAGALFERTILAPVKLSPAVTELHPDAAAVFKDSYLVEFLQLSPQHSEADLQRALLERLKQFLIELGRDFCFVGSDYTLQVGGPRRRISDPPAAQEFASGETARVLRVGACTGAIAGHGGQPIGPAKAAQDQERGEEMTRYLGCQAGDKEEDEALRLHFATSKTGRGGRR